VFPCFHEAIECYFPALCCPLRDVARVVAWVGRAVVRAVGFWVFVTVVLCEQCQVLRAETTPTAPLRLRGIGRDSGRQTACNTCWGYPGNVFVTTEKTRATSTASQRHFLLLTKRGRDAHLAHCGMVGRPDTKRYEQQKALFRPHPTRIAMGNRIFLALRTMVSRCMSRCQVQVTYILSFSLLSHRASFCRTGAEPHYTVEIARASISICLSELLIYKRTLVNWGRTVPNRDSGTGSSDGYSGM